ncbi:MAG TPA: multidrug transporter [Planctomycetota bacterium]|nr:multidrug transporter [Planctomycetota bacterium]
MTTRDLPLTASTRRITQVLWTIAVLLVLASLAGQLSRFLLHHDQVHGLVYLFNVDREENVPTLFSVCLLAFAATLLAVLTLLKKRDGDPDLWRWALLAFGFWYMSVDEAWSSHEKLVRPLRGMVGDGASGALYFTWVIPALALVALLGLVYLRFLLRLPRSTRIRFVVAAALYLGGAIGMELIGGRYAELHQTRTLTYNLIVTAEEGLEMAGSIAFIHALLVYFGEQYGEVRFQVSRDA